MKYWSAFKVVSFWMSVFLNQISLAHEDLNIASAFLNDLVIIMNLCYCVMLKTLKGSVDCGLSCYRWKDKSAWVILKSYPQRQTFRHLTFLKEYSYFKKVNSFLSTKAIAKADNNIPLIRRIIPLTFIKTSLCQALWSIYKLKIIQISKVI